MIATLPMYERAETLGAHNRLWALIRDDLRAQGIDAPERLTRGQDLWDLWESPSLLLAQSCGLPYRARLHDSVTLVGTPDYTLPDTPPGHYFSVIVARAGGGMPETPVPAVSDALSQSGWAALYDWSEAVDLQLGDPMHSHSHEGSARMLVAGQADIAAIDAVTWRFLETYEPSLTRELTVVGDTLPTPGLPLITARPDMAGRLFAAFQSAVFALAPADRTATGLHDIVHLPSSAYLSMPLPPAPAAA